MLLVTTSWEGLLEETDRPAAALVARVPAERSRRVRGGVDVGDLSVDDRLALAVQVLPALDPEAARLLAERYRNPWALQTACRLGAVRRGAARGTLSKLTVDGLPDAVSGLYGQLWLELPDGMREALTLAVLSAPTAVGARLNFGDDRWDPALVLGAVQTEQWLREQAGPLLDDLRLAADAYSWARTVEEWLQRFQDPAQRDVALTAAHAEYSEQDRQALYKALAEALAAAADLTPVRRRHGDRLLLALAAEGFLDPASDSVVEAATRICEALSVSPAIVDQRLLVTIAALVMNAPSDQSQRRLWALQGLFGSALGETGLYADSVLVWRALLADQQRVLGPDAPDTLTTRNNLASWLGQAGQVEAAVEQSRALLADQQRVQGPDAPGTLATREQP